MSDIGTLIGEWAAAGAEAKAAYARKKELEFEIVGYMRDNYADEWKRWERGVSTFKAEGVTVPVSRTYDPALLAAEFGETDPELLSEIVTEEVKITQKVNGKKLAELWKQADMAQRLEKTIIAPVPKIKAG